MLLRLTAILGLALLLRIAAVGLLAPTPLTGDEIDYWQRARALAADGTFLRLGGRPPAMDLFLAGVMSVAGISLLTARVALAITGAIAVLPAFAIGRSLGGLRVAYGTALAVALYPNLIFFSASLWSETLYNVLALGGMAMLLSSVHDRPSALGRAAGAGALLAGGALTRTVAPLFAVLALAWLAWQVRERRGRRLVPAATAAGVFATLIAAWSVYLSSHVPHGTLAGGPVWINLYAGNVELAGDDAFAQYRSLHAEPVERERIAREQTLEAILDRLPWWPLEKLFSESQAYLSPRSFPVSRLNVVPRAGTPYSLWAYVFAWPPANEPGLRKALAVIIASSYTLAALLGISGLILHSRGPAWNLSCLFLFSHFAPAIVSFATPRFRLSSMVILLALAVWTVLEGPAAWTRASVARRVSVGGATAATAAAIAAGIPTLFELMTR